MSVLVRCEKASTKPTCKASTKRENSCLSKIMICPRSSPSPPCLQYVPVVPCSNALLRCTMVQGGFVWHGIKAVCCTPETPPPMCRYRCYTCQ